MACEIGAASINQLRCSKLRLCLCCVVLLGSTGGVAGCTRFRRDTDSAYVTIGKVPVARAEQAKKLNTEALKAVAKGNWEKAESLFQQALESDVNYAPAHNNLGQIYLRRHQLYLAAWEFEFATNLMPDRVEPYINLGLVYETAGQNDKAAEIYTKALDIAPDDRNAIACSARVAVKQNEDPGRIHWLLNQIVMHDNRADWLKWAKELLATRYRLGANSSECSNESSDPAQQPLSGYQFHSLDIGSPEFLPTPSQQLPYDQMPKRSSSPMSLPDDPNGSPSSSRLNNANGLEQLPSPNSPKPSLQEANDLDLSLRGLPTVPEFFALPQSVSTAQGQPPRPFSGQTIEQATPSGMVIQASGEVRR